MDDSGDATGRTGGLNSTTITGLDMTDGIAYSGITTLNISLPLTVQNGFTIVNTDTTLTNLYGGNAGDTIVIDAVSGQTFVYGGAGDDTITKLGYGDTATLNIDGGAGNNTINIDYAGGSNDYLINVTDAAETPTPITLGSAGAGSDQELSPSSPPTRPSVLRRLSTVVPWTWQTARLPSITTAITPARWCATSTAAAIRAMWAAWPTGRSTTR